MYRIYANKIIMLPEEAVLCSYYAQYSVMDLTFDPRANPHVLNMTDMAACCSGSEVVTE